MDNNNLSNIFKSISKPNLSNLSIDQMINIIIEFNRKSNGDFIKESNQQMNLEEIKNKTKNELEEIILEIWKEYEITDSENNVIDCSICLLPITNTNIIYLKCLHPLHSSCLINYIYTNFIELNNKLYTDPDPNVNKINNLFRCPKCRKHLTSHIEDKISNSNSNSISNSISNSVSIPNFNNNNNSSSNNTNHNFPYTDITIDINSGLWVNNYTPNSNSNLNYIPNLNYNNNPNHNNSQNFTYIMDRNYYSNYFDHNIFNDIILNEENIEIYSNSSDDFNLNENLNENPDDNVDSSDDSTTSTSIDTSINS